MSGSPRSSCPIATSLDVVGDKWTLLVIRDLLDGKSRFVEFANSPEHIPTNILTDRLRKLERAGVIARESIEGSKRMRYVPTHKGVALRPILLAMVEWGNAHYQNTWVPPADYLDSTSNRASEAG